MMDRTIGIRIGLLCCLISAETDLSLAQVHKAAIIPAARDWYITQKRVHKEARVAAQRGDREGLYAAAGNNSRLSHGLKDEGAFPYRPAREACDTYNLRVFRLIKDAEDGAGGRLNFSAAEEAGDACWSAISAR